MHYADSIETKIHFGAKMYFAAKNVLGATGLSSTSRYLARWREVLLTQFARSMATKVVVATTWLPFGIIVHY